MKNVLMRQFAMSEKGATDMIRAICISTCSNLSLIIPVWLLFAFTGDYADVWAFDLEDGRNKTFKISRIGERVKNDSFILRMCIYH